MACYICRIQKISFCVLCLFILSSFTKNDEKRDTTSIGMFTPHVFFPVKYHGKIKEVSEKIYLAKEVDGKVVIDRPLTIDDRKMINWNTDFEVYFSPEGLVTRCEILDDQNQILQIYKNQIKNGKVEKFEIVEKDTVRQALNFTYDSRGFIDKIQSYSYPENSFQGTEDFTTDENGNITFIEFFDVTGQSEMKFSMVLDKTGRRTAYTQFNKDGKKLSGANVVFNSDGFIETKTEVTEMDEQNGWHFEYKYDHQGNWIECIANNNKRQLLISRTYGYY